MNEKPFGVSVIQTSFEILNKKEETAKLVKLNSAIASIVKLKQKAVEIEDYDLADQYKEQEKSFLLEKTLILKKRCYRILLRYIRKKKLTSVQIKFINLGKIVFVSYFVSIF